MDTYDEAMKRYVAGLEAQLDTRHQDLLKAAREAAKEEERNRKRADGGK